MRILRNVRLGCGAPVDVAIRDGIVSEIGIGLSGGGEEIDGQGDVLLPGLHDHHLHLLASAARRQSVGLAGLTDEAGVVAALRGAGGAFLRVVDYDERAAGLPDAAMLTRWVPDRPLRLADRTGALWVLNAMAMTMLAGRDLPIGTERGDDGAPTGRFWREDKWLRSALPFAVPDLARLGAELAAFGLTALTDATADNGRDEANLLANKVPQRLTLMGSEALVEGPGYTLGPLKLLIDERDPPTPEALAARIAVARSRGRPVAAHCVTDGELAFYLAALDLAGTKLGDRVEHGALVPAGFVPLLADKGLTVVTNPTFIHDRGDRYRSEVPEDQQDALYLGATLQRAGVRLRGGSDGPYASLDPWLAMRTARDRLTADGHVLGANERMSALDALRLYCHGTVAVGVSADLMLCTGSLDDVLGDLSAERVRLVLIGGQPVFWRS